MRFHRMGAYKVKIGMIMLLCWATIVRAAVDCTTVIGFLSACSTFITYGLPDPLPGSPCCVAMNSLNFIADSGDNRRSVCRCLMSVIDNFSPHATAIAIANLPGLCGISLGFVLDPNTDCTFFR